MPYIGMQQADLMVVERARALLEQATTVDECKDIRDKAEALRKYARQQKASLASQNYAAEIKLRAERKIGLLTRELPKIPNNGARGNQHVAVPATGTARLEVIEAAGLTHQRVSEYERLAAVPEDRFETFVADCRANEQEITTVGAMRALTTISGAGDYDGDEWYTPREVVDVVRLVLGGIDLDPASNAHAQKTVKARRFFTKEDDGLAQEWRGRVFCNPPYSMPLIEEFTGKLNAEFASGRITAAVYLVNNCTDAAWFHSLLSQHPVCFTRGRIPFEDTRGKRFATRQGQALFCLGKCNLEPLKQLGVVVSS